MTICHFCRRNVLESERTWDYHHTSAVEFAEAAKSGCVFCKRLIPSEETLQLCFGIKSEKKALYRWNVRQAAQNRDTRSYFSITFRPVPESDRDNGEGKSEELREFRFDIFPEEELGHIPSADKFGLSTDSVASIAQMKKWLDDCENNENHPRCPKRKAQDDKGFMPTRVLDVGVPGTLTRPDRIRVVETESKKENVHGRYMTLSHCWGEEPDFVKLTKGTFEDFTGEGIPWESTPEQKGICSNANFAEAIEITRKLGIRYLWIDSVCIIQGSPEDWEGEAGLMHQVYRNSYCNLAAVVSKNWEGGLFRERTSHALPTGYAPDPRAPFNRFTGQNWRILPSDLWDNDLLNSPLYARGWVFQERMLSPRLLHFCRDQVFWDCASMSACESLPDGLPLSLGIKAGTDRHWRQRLQDDGLTIRSLVQASEGSIEGFWENAIRAYTTCNIRKHEDKNVAIWGIAKLVRDMLGEEYAYGLWSVRLERQLAWRVMGVPAKAYPESTLKFPSWSWTCLDGPIQVGSRAKDNRQLYHATSHDGGKIGFQLKQALWRRVEGEYCPTWEEELENMAVKLSDGEKMLAMRGMQVEEEKTAKRATDAGDPDKPSELRSNQIEIRGHICPGRLRSTSGKEGWTIAIEGVREEAVVEAYPDIQPQPQDSSDRQDTESYNLRDGELCRFLVLTASRLVVDRGGNEVPYPYEGYDVDVDKTLYSGVGILVAGRDEMCLRRVGMVEFRELSVADWDSFRKACEESEEASEYEFSAVFGTDVRIG